MTTILATTGITVASMGTMSAGSNFSLILLNFIGLGFLTKIDLRILEYFLVILLLLGITGTYLSYRYYKKSLPLILYVISPFLIYVSIFVVISTSVYYVSLIGLITATVLNLRMKISMNSRKRKKIIKA